MFKYRKTQYLKIVSNRTGNVATNKKIKFSFGGKPNLFKKNSKKSSHPRGEWKPTKRFVPNINKADLIVSLKL